MKSTLKKIFCFTLLLLYPNLVWSQYRLNDSKVPIIEKMTEVYKNKSLSLFDLDKIAKELSQDGLFQVVYVDETSPGQVMIRAQQSQKIAGVRIEGNVSFSERELLDKLAIKQNEILSELEIIQAIDRIKGSYQESGFFNFNITYKKETAEKGVVLVIHIAEDDHCVIEEVTVFSKNESLNTNLNLLVDNNVSKNYMQDTSATIEKQINDYLLNHRFLTAKVSNTATVFNPNKTRVKLSYTVTDPTQFEFIFNGNHFFSSFDLIKQSEIGSKFLYLSDSSSEIIDAIQKLYLSYGFPLVTIKSSDQYFPNLQKKVFVFQITEGSRIRIGKISISGKLSRGKDYYVRLFKDALSNKNHHLYFVQSDIQSAVADVVTVLKRDGHLMAEMIATNFEFNKHNQADINIQIDEGILTYVRQVLFRGAKSFSNLQLKDVVGIEPNQPLRIESVEKSFEKLINFYKEKGFLEFKIKNMNATVIQYKPGQPYADIVFQIDEGPKIKVKNIQVMGAEKTKQYVITRELDFKEGDLLTLSRVSNSINRLEKTGLFSKVNIKSLEEGASEGDRTIIVEIEERKPGLFSSGVGLLSQGRLTYRGYVGLGYNNLGGKARRISSRVDLRYQEDVNYPENRLALAYYEPFLMEDRVRGRVSLVRDQQLFDFVEGNSTILSSNEVMLSGEKEFSRRFRFTYNFWNFSNLETFRVQDKAATKTTNVGATGPILEFDYRNDQFLPTQGSYSRWELEYSDPLLGSSRDNPTVTGFDSNGRRLDVKNEINYYKTSFSHTQYTPLTKNKRWVWVNSVRGGYLKNLSSRTDSGVPKVKSFFLGGASTIRGFSIGTTETIPGKRELCIKQKLIGYDQETSQCNFDDVLIRDDSAFFLAKTELRFPLSGALGGLIFYDGGAVYLGDFALDDPYRDSVGAGLRFDTAVGSFVLEVGYKLDRKLGGLATNYDKESDVAIHLAIGNF